MNLQSDLLINKPQLEVAIDRNRASDLGVSARDIASTLQTLLAGQELSTFKLGGETYKVMVQLEQDDRADPRAVLRAYVRSNSSGQLMPLASFVDVRESVAPRGLPHFDRFRSATVSGNLAAGRRARHRARADAQALANEVLPARQGLQGGVLRRVGAVLRVGQRAARSPTCSRSWRCTSCSRRSSRASSTRSRSWSRWRSRSPGALVTLLAVGSTLNLFSQIGLVMLVGLVTKNSILIVEFANQLRERGMSAREAVFEASRIRFRPILMTALATMAGILPIAIGSGAGGESRAPLGIAVFGGVGFSTVLTFLVVPAVYLGFDLLRERIVRRAPRGRAGAGDARGDLARYGAGSIAQRGSTLQSDELRDVAGRDLDLEEVADPRARSTSARPRPARAAENSRVTRQSPAHRSSASAWGTC